MDDSSIPSAVRLSLCLARGHALLVAALGTVCVVGLLAVLPDTVTLPEALSSVEARGRTALFGALAIATLILATTHEPVPEIAFTSPRRWAVVRASRVTSIAAFASVSMVLGGTELLSYSTTVLLTLVGEGLLCARLVGSGLAWLLPAAHVLAAAVVGTDAWGTPMPWAWILRTDLAGGGVLVGIAFFAAGLTTWARAGES